MGPLEPPPELLPYENLSGTAPDKAVLRANEALAGGWSHRGRYQPLRYDEPWPWLDEEDGNAARNFHLHAWDPLNDLLLAHTATGDRRYLAESLRLVDDWTSRFPEWKREGQPEYAWYDMAVGMRAQRLAYVLDAGERSGMLDGAASARLHAAIEQHRRYLAEDENIIFGNNHGFYQVVGQLAMARRFAHLSAPMAHARAQGEARLRRMIDAQFTAEGVHREHSPDYHRMVYVSLRGVVAEGLVGSGELRDMIARIEEALAWFVAPDGTLARFGDSDERTVTYKPKDAQRLWQTPAMRFAASRGVLGAPPDTAERGFADSGYFVAKDRWHRTPDDFSDRGYLAQIAAFHSRAHKHADDLSVVWYDRGEQILVDAGRYGYFGKAEAGTELWKDGYWYSDPARIYIESTRAHNTVEIDGRNHPRKDARPYGSALKRWGRDASGLVFCESEVRHWKVRFARTLVWSPGEWLLVFDWLKDGFLSRHDFRQWFHFAPASQVTLVDGGARVLLPKGGERLSVVPLLDEGVEPSLHLGEWADDGAPRQGFYSPSEKVLVPNAALAFRYAHTSAAMFCTLLAFGDARARGTGRASRSGQSLQVAWEQGGVERRLKLNRPPSGSLQLISG